jgi:hypothetical protein
MGQVSRRQTPRLLSTDREMGRANAFILVGTCPVCALPGTTALSGIHEINDSTDAGRSASKSDDFKLKLGVLWAYGPTLRQRSKPLRSDRKNN